MPLPTLRLPPRGSRRTARGETWFGYSFVPGDLHPQPSASSPGAPDHGTRFDVDYQTRFGINARRGVCVNKAVTKHVPQLRRISLGHRRHAFLVQLDNQCRVIAHLVPPLDCFLNRLLSAKQHSPDLIGPIRSARRSRRIKHVQRFHYAAAHQTPGGRCQPAVRRRRECSRCWDDRSTAACGGDSLLRTPSNQDRD